MAAIVGSDNVYSGGLSFGTSANMGTGTGGLQFDLPLATVAAFQNQALTFASQNSSNNRAFLDQSLTKTGAAVSADTGNVFSFLSKGLDALSRASDSSQQRSLYANTNAQQYATLRQQTQPKAPKPGKSCFITTAVCESEGLPDDCETLTILRKFRDEYMLADPDMAKFVKEYYETAPAIVDAIDALPDQGKQAYTILRSDIDIALARIRSGDLHGGFQSYRAVYNRALMLAKGY